MSSILEETRFIMNKYHIKANKSLGQNFLINEEVVQLIAQSSEIDKDDLVIEIGPGLGTLTKYLLEKAGKVVCRFNLYKNFEVLNQDILKVDLESLIKNNKESGEIKKVKIVANLPYYITTPIIMKLLEEELPLESITVMIQKEVADRLIAIPGQKETGAITYSVYYYAKSQAIFEVPKESFIPEPEVTSKLFKLNIRKEPIIQIKEKEVMFRIIKCAFMQRRKTLLNALVNTQVFRNKEEGTNILEELGLDVNIRPEKLKLEDYAEITKKLFSIIK